MRPNREKKKTVLYQQGLTGPHCFLQIAASSSNVFCLKWPSFRRNPENLHTPKWAFRAVEILPPHRVGPSKFCFSSTQPTCRDHCPGLQVVLFFSPSKASARTLQILSRARSSQKNSAPKGGFGQHFSGHFCSETMHRAPTRALLAELRDKF